MKVQRIANKKTFVETCTEHLITLHFGKYGGHTFGLKETCCHFVSTELSMPSEIIMIMIFKVNSV
jgi:ABC-type antimicrobial peptide transport system permease subunit